MAFWDPSAIIPLCCWQPETAESRRLYREFTRMIVWWGSPIELRSAFARLVRERHLASEGRTQAVSRLAQLRGAWNEILPGEMVRSLAAELPDSHILRAGDAVQLAAALVWCRERPRGRPFLCFDARLRTAAAALGFAVRP